MQKTDNEPTISDPAHRGPIRRGPRLRAVAAALSALLLAGCLDGLTKGIGGDAAGVSSEQVLRVADTQFAAGDIQTAAAMYKRAREIDPLAFAPAFKLGQALTELGAAEEAAEAYTAAVKIDPNDADARRGLANALLTLDKPRLAAHQFLAALDLSEDVRSYNGLGVALDMVGDPEAAQGFYRLGLEVEEGNLTLINNLGLSLALSGSPAEAVPVLRHAVANERATAKHRQNLALAYGLMGDNDAAARIARLDLDEATVQRNLAYYARLRADARAAGEGVPAETKVPVESFALEPDEAVLDDGAAEGSEPTAVQ